MAAPAIGLLLDVFVLQGCFKGAAVQVEGYHIGGSEGALGQFGPEEFIDHSVADEPDPTLLLLLWNWVGSHNDANKRSALVQALVWTVVERAADSTFRAAQVLIGRQVQASLNVGAIEDDVVFATGDIGEVAQIGDDRPGAILAIQAK